MGKSSSKIRQENKLKFVRKVGIIPKTNWHRIELLTI